MYRNYIITIIDKALKKAAKLGELPDLDVVEISIEAPKKKEYGDFSSNIALVIANKLSMDPTLVAKKLLPCMDFPPSFCQRVSVSSKGFINIVLTKEALHKALLSIVQEKEKPLLQDLGHEEKVIISAFDLSPAEFLSVDEGRKLLLGEFLRNIMQSMNYNTAVEPLQKDCGESVRHIGSSVEARYRELLGDDSPFPQDGIKNRYIVELTKDILNEDGAVYLQVTKGERTNVLREKAVQKAAERVKRSLKNVGIEYRNWISARTLIEKETEAGVIREMREKFDSLGVLYEQEGKLWLRSTGFGDQKERALYLEKGEPSELLIELCYLLYNIKRGFTRNIFLKSHDKALDYFLFFSSSLKMLGLSTRLVDVLPVEKVRVITKSGDDEREDTKKGENVTFDELFKMTERDAIRFFFYEKNIDTPLDFEVSLTGQESNENPLYFIQTACARIRNLYKMAEAQGSYPLKYDQVNMRFLEQESDIDILRKVIQFPTRLHKAVADLDPYPMIYFAVELVSEFHNYYSSVKILSNDANLTRVRLTLVEAVKTVLFKIMEILRIKISEKT